MGQVRIADLPSSTNVDKDSYMIVERPGVGDGTYKTTLGDIQEAITVRAKVEQEDKLTTITVKDITGEYQASILTPTAKIVDNGDNTATITITDTDGTTESTVVSKVVIDAQPTEGSPNMVTSGTLYTLLKNITDDQSHDESRLSIVERHLASLESNFQILQNKFDALQQDTETRLEATEEIVARAITVEQNQEVDDPFSTDGERFDSLKDAIMAGHSVDKPVKLFSNAQSEGISIPEGTDFELDLNGYALQMIGPGAGSPGTETNAMQLLKDTNITIKNGKLVFSDDPRLKIGIQNYSNLTLDNVELVGGDNIRYVVSNNYGNIVFKNNTKITAASDKVAFDAWYGMLPEYDPGVRITIEDNTVQIDGIVEFGKANRATPNDFKNNASITTPLGFYLNLNILTIPCEWLDNGDGTKTLRYTGL